MENNEILDDIRLTDKGFENYSYPVNFEFKVGTLANDFVAKDATGKTIAFVRQNLQY